MMTDQFDPGTLCSRPMFFHPVGQKAAAGLWRRISGEKKRASMENTSLLPVEKAHFLLLPDEDTATLFSFAGVWSPKLSGRHLTFWAPPDDALPIRHLVTGLNGMRVPQDVDLVHARLQEFFRRPPTWAETMATHRFFLGRKAEPAVLESEFLQQFFRHCGGPEKAREQFFHAQRQCMEILLSNHRDAFVEKNLNVVVPVQRRSRTGTVLPTLQWAHIAHALQRDVVAVSVNPTDDAVVFRIHPPFSRMDGPERIPADLPDWIRMAFHEYRNLAGSARS